MQVLYAANSLGRLGADFSLMIAELYEDEEGEEVDNEVEAPAEKAIISQAAIEEGAEEANGTEDQKKVASGDVAAEDKAPEAEESAPKPEPEWLAVIKKHRIQAARLEALVQDRVPLSAASRDAEASLSDLRQVGAGHEASSIGLDQCQLELHGEGG